MTDTDGPVELEAIKAQCARIGFDVRELSGLAFSDKSALTDFLAQLRAIPSGVGFAGFQARMRSQGFDLWMLE